MLLFHLAKILKLPIETGLLQESAYALMLESGEVRRAPVLKLYKHAQQSGVERTHG